MTPIKNRSNIGILSGRYPLSRFDSVTNHKVYADLHGYTYINCSWPTRHRNFYFNKLEYIKSYLGLFDYIFWIDDDAFFWDMSKRLEEYLPGEGKIFSACKSPDFKELKTFLSAGQFFLKGDRAGALFLDALLETDLAMVREWWSDQYGYFSNGDQDCMVFQLCNRFQDAYDLHNYQCFNSRVENLQGIDPHDVFIVHFTGTAKRKMYTYKWVQRSFDLEGSLVRDKALLHSYYIVRKKNSRLRKVIDGVKFHVFKA